MDFGTSEPPVGGGIGPGDEVSKSDGAYKSLLDRRDKPLAVMSAFVKVFGCRPSDDGAIDSGAGVRKPPREETALGGRKAVRQMLWGFGCCG